MVGTDLEILISVTGTTIVVGITCREEICSVGHSTAVESISLICNVTSGKSVTRRYPMLIIEPGKLIPARAGRHLLRGP